MEKHDGGWRERLGGAKESVGNLAGKATDGLGDFAGRVAGNARSAIGKIKPENDEGVGLSIRDAEGEYLLPEPCIDDREETAIANLTTEYRKLLEPSALKRTTTAIGKRVPDSIRDLGKGAKEVFDANVVYKQCLEVMAKGFKVVEEQAVRMSVSEGYVVASVNKGPQRELVSSLDELCMLREYDLAAVVDKERNQHLALAFAEGAATGVPGFAGVPFNIVLSTFLYYRAVQSIAMFYGYNVKRDPSELVIAGEVFSTAMAPSSQAEGAAPLVQKIMLLSEVTAMKQTLRKGWAAMAQRGGLSLLVVQMRALAHTSARKALESAGKTSLEQNIFRNVFEQIGKKLTQKAVGKAVPVVGGVVGALFDTGQMNEVLRFADIFYRKRFILEKEARIQTLLGLDDFDPALGD